MLRLAVSDKPPQTSAQVSAAKIAASVLVTFVEDIISIASKLSLDGVTTPEEDRKLQIDQTEASTCLAHSLMHGLYFPGNKSRKVKCL